VIERRRWGGGYLARGVLLAGVLVLASACATPIGVNRVEHTVVYRDITRSVLSGSEPSLFTEQYLRRLGLEARFENEPAAVIAVLHGAGADLPPDTLFVLAELSFLHAERTRERPYYLATAVYAQAFITHPDWRAAGLVANALDPRTRMACDLYNLGLVGGLRAPVPEVAPGEPPPPPEVLLQDATLPLPFGQLELRTVPDTFLWAGYRFSRFIATTEFEIRGIRNRYRQAGIGAPLVAELAPVASGPDGALARKRIPPRTKVPVTAVVPFESVHAALAGGRVRGTLEVFPVDHGRTVTVNNVTIPLEQDPTAAIGYMLEGAPVWDTELGGFLKAGFRPGFGDGLMMMQPYRPGRVPVVLVHGTASSPARWAEIINEVQNDPLLGERVQIWLFYYDTSNPILYSASLLREALRRAIEDLDPAGRDPALRRMVVMGHSQGGMLTRLLATDSGSRFWDAVSTRPMDELKVEPAELALLREAFFFTPQPFVTRVVFLATPHRGSYRVTTLVLGLVRRLVTLPLRLVRTFGDVIQRNPGLFITGLGGALPTAVDNMNPTSHFVRTFSASPIAPAVTVHSIIAVVGTGPLTQLNDTVVRYDSAHLDVGSELVVQSPHSMQSNPLTILEVRRILREHLAVNPGRQ
jgi:pimeloyl-ACP methyl ester carboxylesterase